MKGLILAGGKGTRLQPATFTMNKHMVPILNRPMILYPLETLKYAGITDIMIVTGGDHIGSIAEFLGDGSDYGVTLTYRVQKDAGGIAQALGLAKDFVGSDSVAVVLGDNIFDYTTFPEKLPEGVGSTHAFLFLALVPDASRFGVPEFKDGKLVGIEEKPKEPKSNYAVTGFYIYPPNVFDIISTLKPSARGELELTDVNNWYVKNDRCAHHLHTGFWSDAGTRNSLKEVIDWAHAREF
ncbi:MAG: glucose-1-phosphate thymidylyltransferase [Parcubacteria group bacterium Gr01-1014_56]|nr:MAG: glucose-1-phosphate thymidylyltransferase [Parcubacteria group bacterium Gr01-1014_56]